MIIIDFLFDQKQKKWMERRKTEIFVCSKKNRIIIINKKPSLYQYFLMILLTYLC